LADPRTLLSEDAADLVALRPRPAMHALLYLVLVALAGGLTWAALAPIETRLVGEGTLAVDGDVCVVRAATSGVLRALHVGEGEAVAPGQALFELAADDPTPVERAVTALAATTAELARHEESAAAAREQQSAAEERLGALGKVEAAARDESARAATAARLSTEAHDAAAKSAAERLASIDRELELRTARHARLVEAARGADDARERVEASELALESAQRERRAVAGELERERVEVERSRAAAAERAATLEREAAEARAETARVRAELQRVRSDRSAARRALEAQRDAAREALATARRLAGAGVGDDGSARAFVAGRVARIVSAAGARVAHGEPILVIVPSGARLLAQARIAPVSGAAVVPSQRARVRAGGRRLSRGSVLAVEGPIADPVRGAIVSVCVALEDADLVAAPGMSVSVEVVTGTTTPLGWLFGRR
jgi:multidrug efflux pump subunit AcrA (membrane-fusion protein)